MRTPQSLGRLLSYQKDKDIHFFTTENGRIRIECFEPAIFRIRIDFGSSIEKKSVCASALSAHLAGAFKETSLGCEFSVESTRIEVDQNARLAFYHIDGRALWVDDPMGCLADGDRISMHKALQTGERFLGLGEKTGPLDKRGRQYENWNTDKFAYHPEDDPLYASIPFYMGLHSGLCYGVWVDETGRSTFNFGASNDRYSMVRTESGSIDCWFFPGATPAEVLFKHSRITGVSELPALWTLGFQQCRYSYYPASELLTLARQFRERRIPCDVLYLDIHYMDEYKVFSWSQERFEPIAAWSEELVKLGFKVVAIIDPGLKKEQGYAPFDEAVSRDLVLTHPDGSAYIGEAWPGECAFPDFDNPEARSWWAESTRNWLLASNGAINGLWTDMNEPAVWGKSIPETLISKTEQGTFAHRHTHNAYGYWMAEATRQGLQQAYPECRPFVLTRAAYSGQQRIGAIWTGDNSSGADHLLLSARMIAGMGLSGLPFCGADVGGFIGEAHPELFGRWMQLGAFSPLFRAHSMIHSRDAEPWSFGEEVEEICRNAIELRYRLLPMIYQAFEAHTRSGIPPLRSLALEHPFEERTYASEFENQFFLGDALLVAPTSLSKGYLKVWLPEGEWFDFYTDAPISAGIHVVELKPNALPVYVRAGRGFAAQNAIAHTGVNASTRELHLYWGSAGSFSVYEDRGEGYGYRSGEILAFVLRWTDDRLEFSPACGTIEPGRFAIFVHGLPEDYVRAGDAPLIREPYRWVEPLSNFDPYYRDVDRSLEIAALARFEVDWDGRAASWVLSR